MSRSSAKHRYCLIKHRNDLRKEHPSQFLLADLWVDKSIIGAQGQLCGQSRPCYCRSLSQQPAVCALRWKHDRANRNQSKNQSGCRIRFQSPEHFSMEDLSPRPGREKISPTSRTNPLTALISTSFFVHFSLSYFPAAAKRWR